MYPTRYRKPITSNRLINYHSTIPLHELVNTFVQRFVVASRYDSGGSFLQSYHIILHEMYENSVPLRIMRLCLNRARRYFLGREVSAKKSWLTRLSKEIFNINVSTSSYDIFISQLKLHISFQGSSLDPFNLKDDSTSKCAFQNHVKRVFHVPGDPIIILPYRGPQSVRLHRMLRYKYSACTTVYQHDRYYSARKLLTSGLENRYSLERYFSMIRLNE